MKLTITSNLTGKTRKVDTDKIKRTKSSQKKFAKYFGTQSSAYHKGDRRD